MEKKIDQLLSGKFEYEQPELLFSCKKLTVTLSPGETCRGELYIGTEENKKIRGIITSSDRRLVPGVREFAGTTVCIPYGADAVGLQPGHVTEGWLCFTSNVGEYRLPFEIRIPKAQAATSQGTIRNTEMFADAARNNFREAFRVYTSERFFSVIEQEPVRIQAMGKGLTHQPVTYQDLEEFLIGIKKKEPVRISMDQTESSWYEVRDSFQESVTVKRSGWGHLRLELETRGAFLELPKKVVMDDDFIGSQYQIPYVVRAEKLGEGKNHGKILVRSPYQELVFEIHVSVNPENTVNIGSEEKKHGVSLYRDYLAHRMGKTEDKVWLAGSRYEINALKESGCYYPEYQLVDAFLLHKEGNEDAAKEILKAYISKKFTADELEFAGVWLYLCVQTGLYQDEALALSRLRSFYKQKADSFWLFQVLLEMDPEFKQNPSGMLYRIEEQYERGCSSPLLYLQAWETVSADVSLLHRLTPFWIQVFVFAGRNRLLTQELVMRLSYLSGYEKTYRETLYMALSMGYEEFPSKDTLEAICRYIMLGNPRRPEYFRWYSLAVGEGVRLTRLFEYYVETMDETRPRQLPKSLLFYFTYNHTLGDSRRAAIYANVLKFREKNPEAYENYQAKMKLFAAEKLEEGKINENYAVLYQAYFHDPKTTREARAIAKKMYTCRVFCDDKKLRQVIIRHNQLEKEEAYPLVQGVAYPRIYTDDAVIIFQDDKQCRYVSTVAYNLKKVLDERDMDARVLELGADDPGVLLHYCETHAILPENLKYFDRLVHSDAFSAEYLALVRKKILLYYQKHLKEDPLDDSLRTLDKRAYAQVDRRLMLELLIDQGMFLTAMDVVREFGYEGVDENRLTRLASRMITRSTDQDQEELLQLCSHVYRNGKHDGVILNYLMQRRQGPMEELLAIRKSAAGFDLDTYSFDEKILKLLMFLSDDRKEGEEILESYMAQSGKGRVIGGYLTLLSYGIFVKERGISPFVKKALLRVYQDRWPVNRICRMTLLKAVCRENHIDKRGSNLLRDLFRECVTNGGIYSFYRRLPVELLSPYQLDDKTIVEYHGSPQSKVTICYELDSGLGRKTGVRQELLKNQYEGICAKAFTLFYGETLRYSFVEEQNGQQKKSPEHVITMNQVSDQAASKYQLLNRMLALRKLEKGQEVLTQIRKYLRQEQYVKKMFRLQRSEDAGDSQ